MSWSVTASGTADEVITELGKAGLKQKNCPDGVIGDIKGLVKHLPGGSYSVSASGHTDAKGQSNVQVKIDSKPAVEPEPEA